VQKVEKGEHTGLVLVETDFEGVIVDDAVDVAGEVVQDFKRQVTERLLGALDPLARIRLGECDAEEFSDLLSLTLGSRSWDVTVCCFGKSVKKLNALTEVGVVDAGLETEAMLYGASKGIEKVESSSAPC
jgi:hypothetical protein